LPINLKINYALLLGSIALPSVLWYCLLIGRQEEHPAC